MNENGNKATQLLTCWVWQNSGFFCDDLLEDNVSIRKTNKIGHHCQIQISIKELSCIFFSDENTIIDMHWMFGIQECENFLLVIKKRLQYVTF